MNPDKHALIMISRNVAVAVVTAFVCLYIGLLASFQYANYVDKKSNQQWCGLVGLFNESYKEVPPTNPTGQKISQEMAAIENRFSCP